ncbi:hypothetical protein ACGYLO_11540 [Sulfitobacter sp. 1A13353]|uniref:hypothetical protein n=1 Tax=Sulfitobacter sp. 1A13353 TaxID=3368568 RepID=UPI003746FF19
MTPIKAQGNLLARHETLLDEIYRSRSVTATPETANALAKLESARMVLCDEEGNYRLHPRERRYFDGLYDRNRILETSGAIAEEIRRLGELSRLISTCGQAGDDAGVAEHTEESIDTIMTLRVQIDDKIRIFELEVRNGYHDARTMEERIKRNEVYQERVKELIDVVVQLNAPSVQEFFDNRHARPVRVRYARDIMTRIEPWSVRLSGLAREMLDFMYRTKRIEARTKRFRALLHALESVSVAEQVEALQVADSAFCGVDFAAKIGVDCVSEENEPALLAVAEKLDPEGSRSARRVKHVAGKVTEASAPPPEETDPVESMIDTLIGMARKGEVSVRAWADAHHPAMTGQLVVDLFDHMSEGEEGLSMRTVPDSARYMTSGVHDVILMCA